MEENSTNLAWLWTTLATGIGSGITYLLGLRREKAAILRERTDTRNVEQGNRRSEIEMVEQVATLWRTTLQDVETRLTNQVNQLTQQIDRMQLENATLSLEVRKLRKENTELSSEIEKLRERVNNP